jgi:hypothetical protein
MYLIDVILVLLLAALTLWLRWSALGTEGFHNEDAAGITYNADLLRRGLVPYVHNIELKAPGSYFVSHWAWALFGRSIATLQQVACAWAVVAMAGIYLGGRLLYAHRWAGFAAALLYTVAAPITDSIDINYGAWMIAPYIWSTVFFVLAERRGQGRWLLASGATLAVAGLMKRQAAMIFPVYAGLLILPWLLKNLERPVGWAPARAPHRTLLWFGLGLGLGFAPIMIWYGVHGELGTFMDHYFFSKGGWKYMKGELGWADRLPRIGDGLRGFFEYMAVPTALALFAVIGGVSERGRTWRQRITWRGLLLLGLTGMSFVGASLGFRYFKSYYLQMLPAAVWIAVHPRGPLGVFFKRSTWATGGRARVVHGVLALGVIGACVPAVRKDLSQLSRIQKTRQHPRDRDAQRVARVIKANSQPSDTVWVWGRWAWPVYFHADQLAPTRYYKVLGIITTNLTNTWRRPTKQTTFVNTGEASKALMADLERDRPAFIVVSRNENYSKFKAFRALLRNDYTRVPHLKMRQFVLYHRADHPLVKPPKPHRKAKKRPRKKARPKKVHQPAVKVAPKHPRVDTTPSQP